MAGRWEKSFLYAREFGAPLDAGVLRVDRFTIPLAQVLTSFSTPVTLMNRQVGYLIYPIWGELIRDGAPFATCPGNPGIRYSFIPASTILVPWNSVFMLVAGGTDVGSALAFNTFGGGFNGGTTELVGNFGGSIFFQTATGNPTVSAVAAGCDIDIVLAYYLVPLRAKNCGLTTALPLP
jgi:hypothetical protein